MRDAREVIEEALPAWIAHLRARGVLAGSLGHGRLRLATHLDVDDAGIDRAIAVLRIPRG